MSAAPRSASFDGRPNEIFKLIDQALTGTFVTVPSTPPSQRPPHPHIIIPSAGPSFASPITPNHQYGAGFGSTYQLDPAGVAPGLKSDVWLSAPNVSTPPSPSTIDSQTDSQTGGDIFPPSSETSVSTESNDDLAAARLRSLSNPASLRHRQNLSLSISSLTPFNSQALTSPSSLASSGAPFTDSYSNNGGNLGQDYFKFDDASLPSSATDSLPPDALLVQSQQFGYRLPASQPSSPVRSIYPVAHAPYIHHPGRQRGATFSGSYSPYGEQFGGPLEALSSAQVSPATVFPAHLTYSNAHSTPLHSPVAPSRPGAVDQGYFHEPVETGDVQMGEISMEDVTTPTAPLAMAGSLGAAVNAVPGPAGSGRSHSLAATRRTSNGGSMTPDVGLDRLTILDQIADLAASAKAAVLAGHENEVSANIGMLSNRLEVISNPAPTPQNVSPANSTIMSPVHTISPFHTATHPAMAPQVMQTPPTPGIVPMNIQPSPMHHQAMQQPNLLPALPVDSTPGLQRASVPLSQANTPTSVYASPVPSEYIQGSAPAPPLVHSHSFPNGHQLPSQLHGVNPSPSAVPSPTFASSLGVPLRAPMVSSPLAAHPISRPASPPVRPQVIPEQPWAEAAAESSMTRSETDVNAIRRSSLADGQTQTRTDGRPIINRSRSASAAKQLGGGLASMTPTVPSSIIAPPSAWPSRPTSPEDSDDSDDEGGIAPRKLKRRRSSQGKDKDDAEANLALQSLISEDIRRQLDQIFQEFLSTVCSDLEYTDGKGEKLHQVLMPKKMAKLDESTDYRPFKFRIQAFTNAFHEELLRRGITEETMSGKKVKNYLWRQDLISRFNADGKKAKSKGNHIWNVDAKKLPEGGWAFRPFQRRIIGSPSSFALASQPYEWEPKIWDPQAASDTLRPTYHSPPGSLPSWLSWEGERLVGTPLEPAEPVPIHVIADFVDGSGAKCTLETSFSIQVVLPSHMPPPAEQMAMYVQAQAVHAQAQVQAAQIKHAQAAAAAEAHAQAAVQAHVPVGVQMANGLMMPVGQTYGTPWPMQPDYGAQHVVVPPGMTMQAIHPELLTYSQPTSYQVPPYPPHP